MYDLAYFRSNLEAVAHRLADRGFTLNLDEFRALDGERRAAVTETEQLKARRKSESAEISKLRQQGADTEDRQRQMRELGDRIGALDEKVKTLDESFRALLAGIPNTPHDSVPAGRSAEDNVEIRRWGAPREFDFAPQAHWDLGPALGILDPERAAKVAGARFAVYWDLGARLERALINFMLDVHTRQHGYTEVLPPFLVNSASLFGTGQLPKFAGDLFKVEKTDFWLAPTAEVPVTNLYRDETLDADALPVKLCAYTPCFRSEAGSYGRDVRGIIRQHQFQKVELVKFTRPEQSYAELEALTADAENILQRLALPYRTVVLSTGDIGFSSAKTYDIEVWLPGQNGYKEISSCSNFEAFQARRANIRLKAGKVKAEYAHTLNGSGLA
ncbi:MAG: serine--tRNA ligase, partial [Bryobacteraceae bacterium]